MRSETQRALQNRVEQDICGGKLPTATNAQGLASLTMALMQDFAHTCARRRTPDVHESR
jgi:hypothetical protein